MSTRRLATAALAAVSLSILGSSAFANVASGTADAKTYVSAGHAAQPVRYVYRARRVYRPHYRRVYVTRRVFVYRPYRYWAYGPYYGPYYRYPYYYGYPAASVSVGFPFFPFFPFL